jgi:hypothetical protein
MLKLSKSEKLHFIRIGIFPFFIFSLLIDTSYHYIVAIIIFCTFWSIKVYAKYSDFKDKKGHNI